MPEQYPRSLPQPLAAPYQIDADAGLLRTPMEGGRSRQRRLYLELPQSYELTFVVPLTQLNTWQDWVNRYAYDYMAMDLTSWIAENQYCSPHIVRFTSAIALEMIDKGLMKAKVKVQGEPSGTEVELWMRTVTANGAGGDPLATVRVATTSSARKAILDTFVDAEKAAGTWPLTDDYWLLWGENIPQTLTSLKQRRLAVAVNAPTFVLNRHVAFNGTTQYLNTGFIVRDHGINATGYKMRLAVYERTNVSSNTSAIGANGTPGSLYLRPRSATVMYGTMQSGTATFTLAVANSQGLSAASRDSSVGTFSRGFKNGVAMANMTGLTFNNNPMPVPLYIAAQNNANIAATVWRAASIGFACVGAPLSDAQELAQYNNVQAMATAIGAQV